LEQVKKSLIFITLSRIKSLEDKSIFSDLLNCFTSNGYDVTIVSPVERKFNLGTNLRKRDNVSFLDVKTLNIQKTNLIEKGIGTLLLSFQYISAIKKYFFNHSFDLVLYSTPPITFYPVIKYLKSNKSICYLLLKDIFPQNAVDLKMFSNKSLIYKYFKLQEKKLYMISDYIGCMSKGNVDYILSKNNYLDKKKIEINPNSIFVDINKQNKVKAPNKKLRVLYGGNLGKPQGIKYLINAIKSCEDIDNIEFVIAGNGTEEYLIKEWINEDQPLYVKYYEMLPQVEYENLLDSVDVGIICLDKNFTIPNYPSRILSYMEFKLPVICMTDVNTDIGRDAEHNAYGFWCETDDIISFKNYILRYKNNHDLVIKMGENAFNYFKNNFDVMNSFKLIDNHIKKNK